MRGGWYDSDRTFFLPRVVWAKIISPNTKTCPKSTWELLIIPVAHKSRKTIMPASSASSVGLRPKRARKPSSLGGGGGGFGIVGLCPSGDEGLGCRV